MLTGVSGMSLLLEAGPGMPERLAGGFSVSLLLVLADVIAPGSFGGGDVKLAAAGGLFLGCRRMIFAGAAAFGLAGAFLVFGLAAGKLSRKSNVAFGPFLCAGMAAGAIWG